MEILSYYIAKPTQKEGLVLPLQDGQGLNRLKLNLYTREVGNFSFSHEFSSSPNMIYLSYYDKEEFKRIPLN